MKKEYRIMKFEQIINNIQSSLDIADEIELEEIENDLQLFLSGLENKYDKFVKE